MAPPSFTNPFTIVSVPPEPKRILPPFKPAFPPSIVVPCTKIVFEPFAKMLPPLFPAVPPVILPPLFKFKFAFVPKYIFPPRLSNASPLLIVAFPTFNVPAAIKIFPPQPTPLLAVTPDTTASPSFTVPPLILTVPPFLR